MITLIENTTNLLIIFAVSEERNDEMLEGWKKILNEFRRTYRKAQVLYEKGEKVPPELNINTSFILKGFIAQAKNENEQQYAVFQAGRKIQELETNPVSEQPLSLDELIEEVTGE